MSEYNTVTLEVNEQVATICLNRPENLNSFNREMRLELLAAVRSVAHDSAIRVLVLSGVGKAFSAGADLAAVVEPDQTVEEQLLEEYGPILRQIGDMDQTVIAAIPGVMAGIGAAFAMQCDLSVMADTGRMVMAFSNVGLVPDGGASWNLLRYLGYQRAFELIAEGGQLKAADCLAAGLVNRLVPAEEVLTSAQDWAKALAARPPIALRSAKKLLRAAATETYQQTLAAEANAQLACLASEDSQEAIVAFKEKRQPVFKGK
ncbi:enoyl-CoA hydratase/carnithine racemase [Spongiibacter sp. IMCC21906]|uniref:enoyl-CoA hydratase/isomerase family protein n=1 Tax=Spongiibacter sp. IMCC21906 TaxID=1620392 RepID=UPI00062DF1DE|nr:enoyl-CoA hydratase-related protein [Spongiibacter sp. IMCC21906]AKH70375.1 enoyl-CoA hydratase/carnithine racemase [Spongiibacter sp. IMCC21906]